MHKLREYIKKHIIDQSNLKRNPKAFFGGKKKRVSAYQMNCAHRAKEKEKEKRERERRKIYRKILEH